MHVQIGAFKVVSEAGIASGVRRIEAVVGPAAVEYLNQVDGVVRTLASQFKVKYEDIPGRVGRCSSAQCQKRCFASLAVDGRMPSARNRGPGKSCNHAAAFCYHMRCFDPHIDVADFSPSACFLDNIAFLPLHTHRHAICIAYIPIGSRCVL